jgi:superfamily II DNA/RNA helicase
MDGFRDGTFKILVATDIAARGIDVLGISHVINYDVPDTAETYTHRTGRTGRATRSGQAITFADRDDGKMISLIERNLGKKMNSKATPADFAYSKTEEAASNSTRENTSRQMPRGKKPAAVTKGKSRRSKACSFDFGTSKPVQR